ncbi:MAG: hypothetical protein OQL05_04350 [Gammaproteobacteria bacterium]|nr:hypothetical protein [Gammaproteobacteria bacterium]MCW8972493.1 hypothetical protein [Gammaproteobacteria bacterium]MCW8992157.1 hypothetical protein [Gammaproteobacteria bacterium]
MAIDWITVSAQIVNFLILVWLLKRFLYQPIIRAMERREQRIGQRLNEAQERESQAEEKAHHYQEMRDEMVRREEEFLTKARAEAEEKKKQLLDEARGEVIERRDRWQQEIQQEKAEFLENLQRETVVIVQSIARNALEELADTSLEERIVHIFLNHLKSLDKEASKALSDSDEPVLITTSGELEPTLRGRLTRAVHEQIAEEIAVNYVHSPELICGVELSHGGRRLSWNLADFSDELNTRIEEAFSPTKPAKDEE